MRMKLDIMKILKSKDALFYIVSFLLILFLLYCIYTMFLKKQNVENFASNDTVKYPLDSTVYPLNYIKNGKFENGKAPANFISQSGENKIVPNVNPTSSGYALEQKKSSTTTYYEMQTNCEDNAKYVFYTWTSFRNANESSVGTIDLSKILYVRVLTESSSNNIPNLTFKVEKKVKLKDSNITWYYVSYTFSTGSGTSNLMNINLNYSSALQTDYQYFVGMSLYKVLPEAENFIYNHKLNLFLDGYLFENSKVWNDVSTFSNNFQWTKNALVNKENGYIETYGNKLEGVNASTLFGTTDEPFTFAMILQENQSSQNEMSEISGISPTDISPVLFIPGNNGYSLKLIWDSKNRKFICYLPNSQIVSSSSGLALNNKSMLTILYKSQGVLSILLDGNTIMNISAQALFMKNEKVIINQDESLQMNLYAILNYQRVLSNEEIRQIRDYFVQNQDKNINTFSSSIYLPTSIPSSFIVMDDNTVSPYNRRDMDKNNYNQNEFQREYTNQNQMYETDAKYCLPACNQLCNPLIDYPDQYKQCMRNCKNIIPSCKSYCSSGENKNSIICEADTCAGPIDPTQDCPISYKRDDNYMVYIKPDSYYAKKYNYSGEKSYGKDREKANKMYKSNFAECSIPPILMPGEGQNYLNSCPFIVHESNPCFHTTCEGVKWNVDNYKDLNMSDACKKSVSYYCQINKDLDNMCACWKEENENNAKCIEYRKFFENPKDYCKVSQFNIEEHPDFKKFIRKDKIPCYGCKVD
jgi:hypothetical protein